MNICLLMMAGIGLRFGAERPKQFFEVEGEPVFGQILKGLNRSECVDKIVIVTHVNWIDHVNDWVGAHDIEKFFATIPGGSTRSESVKKGLIKAFEIAKDDDVILIHDAAHPYVDQNGMKQLVEAVHKFGAATMAQRQYDTCYGIDENDMVTKVIPRQFVVSGASPEAFKFKDVYDIYMQASEEELNVMTSTGAIAMAHGIQMKVIILNTINLKITYQSDMKFLASASRLFFGE